MASDLSILIPRLRAAIAALPPGAWPLDSQAVEVVMAARRCGKTLRAYVELAAEVAPALLEHAELYEHLRTRPLDTIALAKGGVFAGRVPDNVVLNGEDLDRAIREDMGQQQPAQAAADAPAPPATAQQDHECRFAYWWPRNRALLTGIKQAARAAWHAAVASSRAAQAEPVAPGLGALVQLVLDDMDVCIGERGSDYEFVELSSETVAALRAHAAEKGGA